MKKNYLGNFVWYIALVLLALPTSSVWAEKSTYFLILDEGSNISQLSSSLSQAGYGIRKRIPNRVMVVESRSNDNPEGVAGIQNVYASVVPISLLEPLGPLAIAAGLQWNRNLVHTVKKTGSMSLSAMQSLVSQNSLPAPKNLTIADQGSTLLIKWDRVYGARLYEIYMSADGEFSNKVRRARTNARELHMPKLSGTQVYVKARTVDGDLRGAWSEAKLIPYASFNHSETLSALNPTSPLDKYESEGFTLILEWGSHTGEKTRLQISKEADFSFPDMDIVLDSSDFAVPSSFMNVGDRFHWRVQAWGAQSSAWSSSREFTVGEPRHVGGDVFINPERPK